MTKELNNLVNEIFCVLINLKSGKKTAIMITYIKKLQKSMILRKSPKINF